MSCCCQGRAQASPRHLTTGHSLSPYPVQGIDPRHGLPKLRQPWVERRSDDGTRTCTQMYYAKRGIVTEEMAFVAAREQLPVDFVLSEVRERRVSVMTSAGCAARTLLLRRCGVIQLVCRPGGPGPSHHSSQPEASGAGANHHWSVNLGCGCI
jgi:hypothetical protein